MEKDKEAI